MKIVINARFGGFGLSEKAYERLIALGVPVRGYVQEKRDPETGLYMDEPANDGKVIFDREFDVEETNTSQAMRRLDGRYWDTWISGERSNDLLIQVVEELGGEASGRYSELKIVEIPDDVEWKIEEYDGNEWVAEAHRTWS